MNTYAQKINISVFNDINIHSITFSPQNGNYKIIVDSTIILTIEKDDIIQITQQKDSFVLKFHDKKIGTFQHFMISAISKNAYFKIKPIQPDINPRFYDHDLYVFVYLGKLLVINRVEMDEYIAGVVQSEGGYKATIEYYKCQAIICRTWAMQNINKHIGDNFNLCDNTHCQSYLGKCIINYDIINAANLTTGLVIVDTTLSLIIATFHSNCGGETAFSEDVWTKPRTYLKSVPDSNCTNSLNAKWNKTIPLDKWKKYLLQNGFKIKDSMIINDGFFDFIQYHRKMYYKLKNDSIPLTKIRADLNLRSTYFSVEQNGDNINIKGKGYGHGVGLCQEGAMKMSVNGYKYMDIIKYYYKNIYIVSTRALQFGNSK